MSSYSLWKIDGYPCLDPAALLEQATSNPHGSLAFYGKANSFIHTRNRFPSHGWLLVTGETLNLIHNTAALIRPVHNVAIVAPDATRSFTALSIVGVQAVLPTALDLNIWNPSTAYLIEIADARYFARDTSVIGDWNYRNAEGSLTYDGGWQEFIEQLWAQAFAPLLGKLHIHPATLFPPYGPENVRLRGDNPWDKFHSILDSLSLNLSPIQRPDVDYPDLGLEYTYVLTNADLPLSTVAESELNDARSKVLDTSGPDFYALPEVVHVFCHSRDYQWQLRQCEDKTPADYWKHYPVRYHVFATADLTAPQSWSHIVPGTTKQLWTTIPYLTSETGDQLAGAELYANCEQIAKRYLAGREYTSGRNYYYLFTGAPTSTVAITAPKYWSGIAYHDLGDGPKTRFYHRPRNFNPRNTNLLACIGQSSYQHSDPEYHLSEDELHHQPDVQRPHHPHYRYAFAYLPPLVNQQTQQPITTLQPRTSVPGVLLSGDITASGLVWNPVCTIPEIWNPFETEVPLDTFNRIEYNYQPGGNGIWQISNPATSGGGGSPDIGGACITSTFYYQTADLVLDRPSLITFSRDSSLRVGRRTEQPMPAGEAIIEIAPGPVNTVFTSPYYNAPPRWTYEPKIWGSVMTGGWYRFAHGLPNVGDGIGPPRAQGSGCRIRLPDCTTQQYFPGGGRLGAWTGAILGIKSAQNGIVETEWLPSGVHLTLYFNAVTSGGTELVWLRFVNGILTAHSENIGTLVYPTHNTDATDDGVITRTPFSHCTNPTYPPGSWKNNWWGQYPYPVEENQPPIP